MGVEVFHLLYNPQVVELAERNNEILMKQIKLLTDKLTLLGRLSAIPGFSTFE